MTKGKFIELVLLKIEGGQLNDSSSVDRRDIRTYLPASINFVMVEAYRVNIQVEGVRDLPSFFYGYFPTNDILTDTTRHNWKYIVAPKAYVPLPRNQGVRSIEDGEGYNLKPLSDNAFRQIHKLHKIFTGDKFYRPEGMKIYLWNLPSVTTNVPCSLIVDSDVLEDTDVLPIQAGLEGKAIDICVEFMTGERQMTADRKSDERDIN